MTRLTVIITAYNREDFVGKCIASLVDAQSAELAMHIIVMDNGSADDTPEVARKAADIVEVIRTEDNRPIAEVINRGFDAAYTGPECDYILLMNEDTQFTAGSVERLLEAAEAHPKSMLTPLQLNYRQPEHLDDNALRDVCSVRELVEDAVLGRPLKPTYSIRTIIGAGMLARSDVWKNIGEFDTTFWFYGVDDDICTRARWLGYEILIAPNSHLYHAHGKTAIKPSEQTWPPLDKWRKETQARYLFRLKEPSRPLYMNYLSTAPYALRNCGECLLHLWPQGMWHSLAIFGHCVGRYGAISEVRRRHFDAARKVPAPVPAGQA